MFKKIKNLIKREKHLTNEDFEDLNNSYESFHIEPKNNLETNSTKKLPLEKLKDKVEENEKVLLDFIEVNKNKKFNIMPYFISVFIFISLGMNYYLIEYANKNVIKPQGLDSQALNEINNRIISLEQKSVELVSNKELLEYNKNLLEENKKMAENIQNLTNKMKTYEETNTVMTEVLMKQKMEFATIVDKVNVLSGGQDGVVLTKDDLVRIGAMEKITYKNKSDIEKLLKNVENTSNINNGSNKEILNYDLSKDDIIENKKQLPVFVVYKINNNNTFYIKNRITNKIFEQAISIKDRIMNRYEVLDIDATNNLVIFKDEETKGSLSLKINE